MNNTTKTTTRRRLLAALLPLGTLLFLGSGCNNSGGGGEQAGNGGGVPTPAAEASTKMASPGGSASPSGAHLTIAVIPKGLVHVFWQSVKAGAEKAGSEMNVTIKWDGPPKESDTNQQVGVVENAINSKVDAILVAPLDKAALVMPIEKAKAANIPVAIFDSAADTQDYVSFVATDNKKGGAMAADRMGKLIDGKGVVAMIPVQPNSASTGDRESGFEDEIKAKFPGIKVIRSSYGMSDRSQSLKVTEDVLTAHPEITAIFGPNESSIVGALQAVKNRSLLSKIKMVGFDSTKQLEESLQKGEIDSLVVQNPFKMGYEGVKALVDFKNGKTPEKRIDTGVALMTKENMNTPEIQALRSKG